jgi:6-phospho-3-hexuloisomerase
LKTEQGFHKMAGSVQEQIAEVVSRVDPEEISNFCANLLDADRIFIRGNGRTGLQMEAFAMRLMHLGLKVHVIGEVTAPGLKHEDLLVIGSSSGNSDSLVFCSRKAEAVRAPITALTANQESPVAKAARTHVFIPPQSDTSDGQPGSRKRLPMGGLFENSLGIVLEVVVLMLMEKLAVTETEMIDRHTNLE